MGLLKKKTRCYIYTRVSTAIQVDGYSFDAQKDKLRKYAEFQDMEIVGEYSDEGHSGKNIKGVRNLCGCAKLFTAYAGLWCESYLCRRWN